MMPVYQAALLVLALVLLLWLTGRWKLHPFLALFLVAVAYGLAADMSVTYIGQSFALGFTQTVEAVGLVIVAGQIVATFAARSGAGSLGSPPRILTLPLGLVAGVAASVPAVFALLAPMRSGLTKARPAGAVLLALALLAGHGLLVPAPGPVAAAAILKADLTSVLIAGAPVAVLTALAGWFYLRRFDHLPLHPDQPAESPRSCGGWRFALPIALPLAALMVQSIGLIPSEPLGGGHTRELLIGIGRPAFLLFMCLAAVLLITWRFDATALSERGWIGEALVAATSLLLITGAAGGFAKVLQNTGMPELLAERLLSLPAGLLLPFLVAAVMKVLQGSTLVAAITAAGMTEPLLAPLGLDGDWGRTFAVLAIGAGSITASHVNDPYFWLVDGNVRLGPGTTLRLLTLGSLLQGLAAILLLLIAGALLI
jgi:GntP family gluconate:H+ symporter